MVDFFSISRVLTMRYRALWTKAVTISVPRSSRIKRSHWSTRSTSALVSSSSSRENFWASNCSKTWAAVSYTTE